MAWEWQNGRKSEVTRPVRVTSPDSESTPRSARKHVLRIATSLLHDMQGHRYERNKKLLGTSATLVVTGALLVVTRSY